MSTNEAEVYFALDGDNFDPDAVTNFIGLEPTTILRKDEIIPGRKRNYNSWKLSTGKKTDELIDVYEMASSITNILAPKVDLIIQAQKKFEVKPRLEVVLWFSTDDDSSMPAIGFDEATVEFLGHIGAFIDIDTYIL